MSQRLHFMELLQAVHPVDIVEMGHVDQSGACRVNGQGGMGGEYPHVL